METSSFSNYCESFLKNPDLGSHIFFQNTTTTYTYKNLIEDAYKSAAWFSTSPDVFFALKIESPLKFFPVLLGAILAKKNILILSHKEPPAQLTRLQETIPFTQIISDNNFFDNPLSFQPAPLEMNSTIPAFFILSSGSSGPARGIPLSLDNVYTSAKAVIDFFKMSPADTSFLNLPLHHIGGLMIFWRSFFSRGKITTDESLNYQFISLVPLQLKRMLSDETKTAKLKNCRAVLIGGAPLEISLKDEASQLNIPLYETYGMSETSSLVMLNGTPLPGAEIKLNTEGNFQIRSKTLSLSAAVDSEGFYHTQDAGRLNPDGTFTFLHRSDLLFKSGGELINPLQLESLVKELTWLKEAVVVPIKHHEWTQAAVLVYKSSDSTKNNSDEIVAHLKKHIHPHHIPKYLIEAPDNILSEGIKPRRFDIGNFAQTYYYKNLFHHLFIPSAHSKRLVVFIHGFMEDHTDLIPLMDNHIETSFLFLDLPGHGKTKVGNFKTRDSVFSELRALINFYKAKNKLVLYGYSMGGRVALELTLMGLSVENLILESSHFGLASKAEKKTRFEEDKKLFTGENIDLGQFFENWYKNPIFADYNKSSHFKLDLEKKMSHDKNEWDKSLDFFSPGVFPFEFSDVLTKLKDQKISGIVGTLDKKYLHHFEGMHSKLSQLSIYEIEDCGHNPHKTHLNDVKKILRLID